VQQKGKPLDEEEKQMGKYQALAEQIVKNVGGKENVAGLVHCITRLRFTLRDEGIAKDQVLKDMEGVVTVMKSGGQYQVVIGNHVPEVFEDVMELLDLKEGGAAPEEKKKGGILDRAIDIVSGIFQPILGIMAACGMLKGLNTLLVTLGLYSADCGGYLIINAAGDALFTFLPLFLGYTAAKKFNLKPMLGLAIGAAMCYPVILAVWFASKCEKLFSKYIPDLVKFFFVPMLTLLVTLPVSVIFLGPVATFGSTLISEYTLAIRSFSPMLAGGIVGLTWQILVIFGMHWGFIPVYINNVMTLGYDNVMMPFFACTFATSAVVLAIFFKTKDKKLKEMAIPNFISGIFGVTEPAIYGILLPLKKPFIISCIAGGIGGAFYGHFNFRKFILGGMGIFELPNMMNPDGTMGNILVAFAGIAISMIVGFVLTMIFYKEEAADAGKAAAAEASGTSNGAGEMGGNGKETELAVGEVKIYSPLKGKTVKLEHVEDEAFSSGLLGKGVAIMPDEGVLYAPVDGTISALFPTGHAIGMTMDNGVELLMHVGMDTVQLEGKGFQAFTAVGEKVTKGQKLLEFDMELIREAGYSLVTPVLIVNAPENSDVVPAEEARQVQAGEELIVM
jgi:PTS system beta-glucosides-specific IIC component